MENKEIRRKSKLKRLGKQANRKLPVKISDLLHELNIYKAILFTLSNHNCGEFQVKINLDNLHNSDIDMKVTRDDSDGLFIVTIRAIKKNSIVQY